jgi:hypothetical protein
MTTTTNYPSRIEGRECYDDRTPLAGSVSPMVHWLTGICARACVACFYQVGGMDP